MYPLMKLKTNHLRYRIYTSNDNIDIQSNSISNLYFYKVKKKMMEWDRLDEDGE
jgi:hypothetical protein